MKIAAATTFSLQGYNNYANKLIETFDKFWDKSIDLYAYYDEMPSNGWNINCPNIHYLPADFPDLLDFKKRNANHPKQSTKEYLKDAIRFSHKVYAYVDMALNKNVDIAIWLDGDTITHQPVDENVIKTWLQDKMAGALFRPTIYTETGFHIFDMRRTEAKEFMKDWIDWYNSDRVWILGNHTDCHTYDETIKKFDKNLWNNLSPPHNHPHPFINGILGKHMDHLKGGRKQQGRSHLRDLATNRTEDYWKNK